MKPGLYIVGTPIGNLEDTTARTLETLRNADLILAEDTRRTRILLDRFQIKARLESCHRFNEYTRVPFILDQIRAGRALAFVTNAGMPGVSDPGALVVKACRQNGLYLTVIPGASSVTAAIALSGFGGGGFIFEGFLPRKKGARRRRLEELKNAPLPLVVFESPFRALQFLQEAGEIFPDREIFMGRELTKLNEECLWGTAAEIIEKRFKAGGNMNPKPVKGELTFVIAPASKKVKHLVASHEESLRNSAEAIMTNPPSLPPEADPLGRKSYGGSPCHSPLQQSARNATATQAGPQGTLAKARKKGSSAAGP